MRPAARVAQMMGRTQLLLARLASSRNGNIALIFALLLPVLLVTSLGAIELQQVMSDKKRSQDVADAAALMGAGQLGVSPNGAAPRAQSFAQGQLSDVARYAAVSVQATAGANDTMTVAVDTQRDSFFGNLLPLGGFHTHVTSTAQGQNTAPLCVLTTGASAGGPSPLGALTSSNQLTVDAAGVLQAGNCLVHSQSSITALGLIQSELSEAVGAAAGLITPAPIISAAPINDPFSDMNVDLPAGASCAGATPLTLAGGATATLAAYTPGAGLNGAIEVSGSAILTLAPGTHYFCGALTLTGSAKLNGSDVVLVFEPGSSANFGVVGLVTTILPNTNQTRVSLTGRQSGPMAGFVVIANRQYTSNFVLDADAITNLTGSVYAPAAPMFIQGSGLGNQAAPWTVITAQGLTITGGTLVINANYSTSQVPVPVGVGDRRTSTTMKLTQ